MKTNLFNYKTKALLLTAYVTLVLLLLSQQIVAQSPDVLNYQAVIRNASGELMRNATIGMQISILQGATDGTAVYTEEHTLQTNNNGLVTVQIGAATQNSTKTSESNVSTIVNGDFSAIDWGNGPYFIKVETDPAGGTNYTITGISQLLSVPYALHAKNAAELNGHSASELDQSAHVERTDNPHHVTAAQTGAATIADLTWANLSGIPAGFADGVDNGNISMITAGSGLTGGGDSGVISLNVAVPFVLTDSTSSGKEAIIKGANKGNGYGVYGWSASNYGVYGYSSALPGVLGYSNDKSGVEGMNGSTGNEGKLGTADYGVIGIHAATGNKGKLGGSMNGVMGYGKGNANGVWGSNENGNYAYLGGAMYSVYSAAHDDKSWAGYFLGKTTVSGGKFEIRNSTGENWATFLRGNNQHGGASWQEQDSKGKAVTQWIFPYFRGWQSDNLIIRDEAAKKDVMVFKADSGMVGIGTVPETLLHISSGADGDATLLIEADTDNSDEDDQPRIEMRQDGGQVTAMVGFDDASNNLQIRASNNIEFYNGDEGSQKMVASFDTDGNLNITGNIIHKQKTGHLWLPAGEFVWSDGSGDFSRDYTRIDITNGHAYFSTSVHLPNKAVVTELSAYINMSDAEDYIGVYLHSFQYSQRADTTMAAINMTNVTSGYLNGVDDSIDGSATIDNIHKAYYVAILLNRRGDSYNSLCRFRGARITYQYADE